MTTTNFHHCAAEGCNRPIATHLLMCVDHWKMVPRGLQQDVYRTYRAWSNAPLGKGLDKRKAYIIAVNHAITAVREKEIQRAIKNQQHGDTLDLGPVDTSS